MNVHLQRELKICSHFLGWVWMVSFQENRFSQCCLLMLNLWFVMLQYKYKSLLMWDDASSQEVCRIFYFGTETGRGKSFPSPWGVIHVRKGVSDCLPDWVVCLECVDAPQFVSFTSFFFHFCKDLIWLFPFLMFMLFSDVAAVTAPECSINQIS